MRQLPAFIGLCTTLLNIALHAEVMLPSHFSDHMVLQRNMKLPVWGTADPGETVTVEFAGQQKSTQAAADGKWRIDLDPLPASFEGRRLTVNGSRGKTAIQLADVLVGEVWLCSGQSNMEFTMAKTERFYFCGVTNEAEELAAANYPAIRMFTSDSARSYDPRSTIPGCAWKICTSDSAREFSAIGYFFARDLQKEIKTPIGILTLTYGASTAQAWIQREALVAEPQLRPMLEQFDADVKASQTETNLAARAAALAKWDSAVAKAKAEGKKAPRRPRLFDPVQDQHSPTVMFNGVIAPVIPYAIRGVLWYQGESITTGGVGLYPLLQATLIKNWRQLWGEGDFPFFICQLAACNPPVTDPNTPGKIPLSREAQATALALPNTGMAVTIDIGDASNVHPKNKQDVGNRLMRIALARVYGRQLEYSGPAFESMRIEENAIRVKFSHVGGGLVAKGGALKQFSISGADNHFVWANAVIDGKDVVVSSSEVKEPRAVRYAWADNPEGLNLYNAEGLPAAPFRAESSGSAEPAAGRVAAKPLFRDPVHDGAADPAVVYNHQERKWLMFYTNRRANATNEPGVAWVHNTRIAIAESADDGATWHYRGVAEIPYGEGDYSHWAPEILWHSNLYHMFLTFVPGMHTDWSGTRDILHLTSTNLLHWQFESVLNLSSTRVIDPCVLRLPDGSWRLWYNNEADHKSIYYADSPDLYHWQDRGKAIGDRPGEGPKVFRWKNFYWMVVDNWQGLGVYQSSDALHWKRQLSGLLDQPGHGPDDQVKGGHPDVVVSADRAFLFYFTHPGRRGADEKKDAFEQRRSSIQVVELEYHDGLLACERDRPTHIRLEPPEAKPTLFLIGDSTVRNRTRGQLGWGDPFAAWFDSSRVTVTNRALGGRSSRTFLTEGLWDKVLADLKPGDFVLMQFGHNDGGPLDDARARASLKGNGDESQVVTNKASGKVETVHTYGWYLRRYITDAKAKGATPVVLSLVPRKIWKDRKVVRANNDYGKWAKEAAAAENVAFVDLNEIIASRYETLGPEKVEALFGDEHTHTNEQGARLNAECVVMGLRGLKDSPLAGYLAHSP